MNGNDETRRPSRAARGDSETPSLDALQGIEAGQEGLADLLSQILDELTTLRTIAQTECARREAMRAASETRKTERAARPTRPARTRAERIKAERIARTEREGNHLNVCTGCKTSFPADQPWKRLCRDCYSLKRSAERLPPPERPDEIGGNDETPPGMERP